MKINLKYTDRIGGQGDLSLTSLMEVHGGISLKKDPAPTGEASGMMVSSWDVPDDRAEGCIEAVKSFQNVEYEVVEKAAEKGGSHAKEYEGSEDNEGVQRGKVAFREQGRAESEEPKAGGRHRTK